MDSGDDELLYAVPDMVTFKNYCEMQPRERSTRRLLLRAADTLKSKMKIKVLQPNIHAMFSVLGDHTEIQPGGTLPIVVEFEVPERDFKQNIQVHFYSLAFAPSLSMLLQDWVRVLYSGSKRTLLVPIRAIHSGDSARDDEFEPSMPPIYQLAACLGIEADGSSPGLGLACTTVRKEVVSQDESEPFVPVQETRNLAESESDQWSNEEKRYYAAVIAAEEARKDSEDPDPGDWEGDADEFRFYRAFVQEERLKTAHVALPPATQAVQEIAVQPGVFLIDGIWVDALGREVDPSTGVPRGPPPLPTPAVAATTRSGEKLEQQPDSDDDELRMPWERKHKQARSKQGTDKQQSTGSNQGQGRRGMPNTTNRATDAPRRPAGVAPKTSTPHPARPLDPGPSHTTNSTGTKANKAGTGGSSQPPTRLMTIGARAVAARLQRLQLDERAGEEANGSGHGHAGSSGGVQGSPTRQLREREFDDNWDALGT